MTVEQLRGPAIMVNTVTLPASLKALSASELTLRLADAIDSVQFEARPSADEKSFTAASDVNPPDIEIPGTQTSLPKVASLIRFVLGRDTRDLNWEVSGVHVDSAHYRWIATAHLAGHRSHREFFDPANPDPAISALARNVIGDVEPLILARAILYAGDWRNARLMAEHVLSREATSARAQSAALNFIGFASEMDTASDGQPWESARYYRDAIEDDPTFGLPHANLGRLIAKRASALGDSAVSRLARDSVIAEFERADRLAPRHAGVHEAWGWAFLQLGEPREAIDHLTVAIRLEPRIAEAYFTRADAFDRIQRYRESAADYSRGLARSPGDAQHAAAYAFELALLRDWRGSVGAWDRLHAMTPTDSGALFWRACALRHLDSARASAAMDTVIRLYGPESRVAAAARTVIATGASGCVRG